MTNVVYAKFANTKLADAEFAATKSATYTMSIENDAGEEEIVAHGIPLGQALTRAIEHDGAGKAVLHQRDVGRGRCFSIGRKLADDSGFECLKFVFVHSPPFSEHDEERARRTFERLLLENTGVFWHGRVETDVEYAGRHPYG